MIRITVDKNGKNVKLNYDDTAHQLNEYTLFFKEHMSNLRQKYFDMIKIYWYLPSDCYGLDKLCDNIFRTDSKHFKYVKEDKSQFSTVYCYDNK